MLHLDEARDPEEDDTPMAEESAEQAKNDEMSEETVGNLVELLESPRRRQRQEASHLIASIAQTSPDKLVDNVDALIDALYRPEAQTRWECFDALSAIAAINPEAVEGAYDPAETSLFDELSATVRLSAFKFLAKLGSTSPERSERVWPLLDESVQCYHGDPEYHDMLTALIEFAKGDISDEVRQAMVARVSFDAQNGRGYVKSLSQEICDLAEKQE